MNNTLEAQGHTTLCRQFLQLIAKTSDMLGVGDDFLQSLSARNLLPDFFSSGSPCVTPSGEDVYRSRAYSSLTGPAL